MVQTNGGVEIQAGKLSIIIINYNARVLTTAAVASIFSTKPKCDFEIIIVENGTKTEECYQSDRSNVVVLPGVENKGFGHACNIGVRHAKGEYLLFLNNDTIMHPQTLDKCLEYLQHHQDVGALSARTLLRDGTLDHGCKRGFPTPMASLYYFAGMDKRHPESRKYGAYRQTFVPEESISEVDAGTGAFLMMPNAAFERAGGFDEQFFMYAEDIDLCYRVKELGYKIMYYGKASLTHLKGQSGLNTKSKQSIFCFYDSMWLFYKKHYVKKHPFFVTWGVYLGIQIKYWLTLWKRRQI